MKHTNNFANKFMNPPKKDIIVFISLYLRNDII